jgi:cobalt-zinc-cadmium efflux system outer membrane protein
VEGTLGGETARESLDSNLPIAPLLSTSRLANAACRLACSVALLAVAMVSACATGATPDRAKIATAVSERSGVDAKGLKASDAGVWSLPPDTTLDDGLAIDEAVAIALWNNPDFQVALTSLGIARADLIEAGTLRNPVFSLLFPWGPKQLEFTLTWAIDAIWQRPKRIAGAKLNAESVVEQLVAGGLRVVADVRTAFFEQLTAERRLALSTELASLSAEAARLADGQFRAGAISELDARVARADAVRLETVRLSRVTARDLAVARFRALLGLESSTPSPRLIEPSSLVTADCGTEATLLTSALAARPEVRAAELQIEAAGERAGIERAKIPAITASLDANGKGTQGFEMGPGLAIELPIFSQNQAGRAKAVAEIEQAARRYTAVRANVEEQVAAAFAGFVEARATAALLGDEVENLLATARRQTEGLYAAGEISLLDLLQRRQRLIDLEATRLDAAFGVNRAIVRLEQAIGRSCQIK